MRIYPSYEKRRLYDEGEEEEGKNNVIELFITCQTGALGTSGWLASVSSLICLAYGDCPWCTTFSDWDLMDPFLSLISACTNETRILRRN